MGGDYYERDVQAAGEYEEYSDESNQLFLKNTSLSKSLDPKRFKQNPLKTNHKSPIIFALDVTGSMGDWSKVTISNKNIISIFVDNV